MMFLGGGVKGRTDRPPVAPTNSCSTLPTQKLPRTPQQHTQQPRRPPLPHLDGRHGQARAVREGVAAGAVHPKDRHNVAGSGGVNVLQPAGREGKGDTRGEAEAGGEGAVVVVVVVGGRGRAGACTQAAGRLPTRPDNSVPRAACVCGRTCLQPTRRRRPTGPSAVRRAALHRYAGTAVPACCCPA